MRTPKLVPQKTCFLHHSLSQTKYVTFSDHNSRLKNTSYRRRWFSWLRFVFLTRKALQLLRRLFSIKTICVYLPERDDRSHVEIFEMVESLSVEDTAVDSIDPMPWITFRDDMTLVKCSLYEDTCFRWQYRLRQRLVSSTTKCVLILILLVATNS